MMDILEATIVVENIFLISGIDEVVGSSLTSAYMQITPSLSLQIVMLFGYKSGNSVHNRFELLNIEEGNHVFEALMVFLADKKNKPKKRISLINSKAIKDDRDKLAQETSDSVVDSASTLKAW